MPKVVYLKSQCTFLVHSKCIQYSYENISNLSYFNCQYSMLFCCTVHVYDIAWTLYTYN